MEINVWLMVEGYRPLSEVLPTWLKKDMLNPIVFIHGYFKTNISTSKNSDLTIFCAVGTVGTSKQIVVLQKHSDLNIFFAIRTVGTSKK